MRVGQPHSLNQPPDLVAWRPKLELEILAASNVLDLQIIRPALISGPLNTICISFIKPIDEGTQSGATSVSITAEPESRPGLVHFDDLGLGLHCAIDKAAQISGTGVHPLSDLQISQESMRDVLEAAAKEFGFEGVVKLAGAGENFAWALSTSVSISSGKVKTILGWEPKIIGVVSQMDVPAKAWAGNAGMKSLLSLDLRVSFQKIGGVILFGKLIPAFYLRRMGQTTH